MPTAGAIASNELPVPPAAAVVRSRVHRQQMETRLRLRRRLLRLHSDADSDGSLADPSDSDSMAMRTGKEPLKGRKSPVLLSKRSQQPTRVDGKPATKANGADEGDEEQSGGDGEEDEEDEEDDDDGDGDGDDEAAGPTTPAKTKGEKCPQSAVVRLLFSRSDPQGRAPTVWFEYPPHLQEVREPPSVATGCVNRLVSVNATDCELLFKTHWERNCVKNAFAAAGLRRTKKRSTGWHVAWAKHMPRDKFKTLRENQAFSHFPDPWVIGRKDRLLKTLLSCKRRFGSDYAFFPDGFTLPDHLDAFKRATSSSPASLWILKPPAAACGRGIRVVAARDVDSFLTHEKRRHRKFIAQRYIVNPLLVDGFKFDLRIYVLVTSVDPLRIYLFHEGLTRFCTTPYSLGNTKNRFAHLTNYSLNKHNTQFVENASAESDSTGNKWSMTALLDHLHQQGVVQDVAALRQQIKDIICKTVIAAEAHLTPLLHQFVKGFRTQRIKCFELFGFDLMLDDTCTPWLIEANVSPSLMAGSPLDRKVKGLLLSDIFHLVGVSVPSDALPREMIPEALRPQARAVSNVVEADTPRSARSRAGTVNKQLHEIALDAKRPVFEKHDLELFTAADWSMVHDMDDEMERLGHFERIFPCGSAHETAKYAQYFTCPRYSNALCAKWIETKQRARTEAAAVAAGKKPPPPKPRRSNSYEGVGASHVANMAMLEMCRPIK